MRSAGSLLWLLVLASCCGIRIDYVSTSYSDSDSGGFGVVRRGHFIRVFFASPLNLARVSAESGLMCVLEIQGQEPVRMSGHVYRDLRSPVWRGMLAYQSWDEPDAYAFYGEVELDDRVIDGVAADGEFIVHSPGMFIRCPISNTIVVPQADLVGRLPNSTQQPTDRAITQTARSSNSARGPRLSVKDVERNRSAVARSRPLVPVAPPTP